MWRRIIEEIKDSSELVVAEQGVGERFLERLRQGRIYKEESRPDHVCVFMVPYYKGEVFVGHHKKANAWIPPGGHLEMGELPQEAVKREFVEELQYQIDKEKVVLFGLSKLEIERAGSICKRHWDMWYGVLFEEEKPEFVYEPREFYAAEWVGIEEAVGRVDHRGGYRDVLESLTRYL